MQSDVADWKTYGKSNDDRDGSVGTRAEHATKELSR